MVDRFCLDRQPNSTMSKSIQKAFKRNYCEMENKLLNAETLDRIIEMAWEDRTPFEAIELQYGLSEKQVIALMRQEMKGSSFKMWRKRVTGRKTKHLRKRDFVAGRFKSQNQK
jgi:uncharacterized protein (TIGR03643 family)